MLEIFLKYLTKLNPTVCLLYMFMKMSIQLYWCIIHHFLIWSLAQMVCTFKELFNSSIQSFNFHSLLYRFKIATRRSQSTNPVTRPNHKFSQHNVTQLAVTHRTAFVLKFNFHSLLYRFRLVTKCSHLSLIHI